MGQPWQSSFVKKWEQRLLRNVTHKCKTCGSRNHSWRVCPSYFKDWEAVMEEEACSAEELQELLSLAAIWWQAHLGNIFDYGKTCTVCGEKGHTSKKKRDCPQLASEKLQSINRKLQNYLQKEVDKKLHKLLRKVQKFVKKQEMKPQAEDFTSADKEDEDKNQPTSQCALSKNEDEELVQQKEELVPTQALLMELRENLEASSSQDLKSEIFFENIGGEQQQNDQFDDSDDEFFDVISLDEEKHTDAALYTSFIKDGEEHLAEKESILTKVFSWELILFIMMRVLLVQLRKFCYMLWKLFLQVQLIFSRLHQMLVVSSINLLKWWMGDSHKHTFWQFWTTRKVDGCMQLDEGTKYSFTVSDGCAARKINELAIWMAYKSKKPLLGIREFNGKNSLMVKEQLRFKATHVEFAGTSDADKCSIVAMKAGGESGGQPEFMSLQKKQELVKIPNIVLADVSFDTLQSVTDMYNDVIDEDEYAVKLFHLIWLAVLKQLFCYVQDSSKPWMRMIWDPGGN